MFDRLWQSQCAQEVSETISKRVQLEPNLVVAVTLARKPRPVDGVLALLDMLLRRGPSIVELRHPRSRSRQVGDDEADAGIKLAGMPLDLGHDTSGFLPGRRLLAEGGMKDPDMVRRSPDGAGQKVRDLLLQDRVGRQADGVGVAFGFQNS